MALFKKEPQTVRYKNVPKGKTQENYQAFRGLALETRTRSVPGERRTIEIIFDIKNNRFIITP